jgi:hypothetical protein
MKRRTFDRILSMVGAMLTLVLIVAGAMLMWGANFASSQVSSQLKEQGVYFPAKGDAGFDAKTYPTLQKWAGQQLTTGEQAKAYANDYIAHHLKAINGGKNYAQTSADAMKLQNQASLDAVAANNSPEDQTLVDAADASATAAAAANEKVNLLFRGETLRGLLLTSFAFWQIGQIAFISGIFAFGAAIVMLILTLLGFAHLRRTPADAQI